MWPLCIPGNIFPDGCGSNGVEQVQYLKDKSVTKSNDEDQCEKPDVIKMLFKGTFSENSKEVLENLNKFKKINFGNRDANRLDAHLSGPENRS